MGFRSKGFSVVGLTVTLLRFVLFREREIREDEWRLGAWRRDLIWFVGFKEVLRGGRGVFFESCFLFIVVIVR